MRPALPQRPRVLSYPGLGPAPASLGPPTISEGRQCEPIERTSGRRCGRLRSSLPPPLPSPLQAEASLALRKGCEARAACGFLVCLGSLERGKRGSRQGSREHWRSGSSGMGRAWGRCPRAAHHLLPSSWEFGSGA